jgi:hypothetical protein
LYNLRSYLKQLSRLWRKPADVPRRCIFDERYGCVIPFPIPTHNLGTSFDMQVMAGNCGYSGKKDVWWHVHHSAPAFKGGMAQTCPHSYRPGQVAQAKPCKCATLDYWQEKIVHVER